MCSFMMSVALLVIILSVQAIAFLGFTVISFGISLIGVLLLKIKSDNEEINVTIWAIVGLVILSHVSEGLFLGYWKTGIKAWIDEKKRRAPNVLVKIPLFIYFVLFCAAVSQCYFQHPFHNQMKHISEGSPGKVTDVAKPRFSLIFLLCMAYIAYMAAASSDWVAHISRTDFVRQKLSFRSLVDCVVCIDMEMLCTFMNVFLLAVYAVPIILGFYGFSAHYIFLSAMATIVVAVYLKVDKACPPFQCRKTPCPEEFKLFAKSFVLEHVWFPAVVAWFMKNCKVVILSYELSETQDFAVFVSLLSITLFKAARNITFKIPSLAVRDNRIATEPMGGGDNDRVKIPPTETPSHVGRQTGPSDDVDTEEDEYSSTSSETTHSEGADADNANNNKTNVTIICEDKMVVVDYDIPGVHQPSAPTFEEINEVQTINWTRRPARKWPGNDFTGSRSHGYAGYSDMV